jgi:hypothetical protein
MPSEEFELVELSDCCKAEMQSQVRYPATPTCPAEHDVRCLKCGGWCNPVSFQRSLWDGTLTEKE